MLSSILGSTRQSWSRSPNRAVILILRSRLLPQRCLLDFCRHATTTTTTTTTAPDTESTISAAKEFKKIPVEPTILQYIDMIGVGRINIANLKSKRSFQRRRRKGSNDDGLLNTTQEDNFFKDQELRNRVFREQRPGRRGTSLWLPPPPFGFTLRSQATNESGRRIKRLPVKVLGSPGSANDPFPRASHGLPEVALAGRSNVGKSTLLNALLYGNLPSKETSGPIERKYGRSITPNGAKLPKGVKAVMSDRPGETKHLTFYQLSAEVQKEGSGESKKLSLLLVDLPGYGFAYASEERTSSWNELMKQYLVDRGNSLKRILLLIDARHGMKKADFEFLDSLQAALYAGGKEDLTPIQIVLTKCDLVDRNDLARRVVTVRQQLSDGLRREPSLLPVMLVSARAGIGFNNVKDDRARGGILELQKELAALVPDNKLSESERNVSPRRMPRESLVHVNKLPSRTSISRRFERGPLNDFDDDNSPFAARRTTRRAISPGDKPPTRNAVTRRTSLSLHDKKTIVPRRAALGPRDSRQQARNLVSKHAPSARKRHGVAVGNRGKANSFSK